MSMIGTIKFQSNLTAITKEIERELMTRAFDAANEIRNEWITVLSGNRSGRTYRIPGTKRTYVASAPGEAPAVQFGDLRRSIFAVPAKLESGVIISKVGSTLEKALILELGTRKMRPRPHASVAWKNADARVKAILSASI
jgi:hypothetical protein